MKKSFLVIITFFLLIRGVNSQVLFDGMYPSSFEEEIKHIDTMTAEIKDNLRNFKIIENFKDSSNYRYIYKKGKEVQLVSIYSKDKDQNIFKVKEFYFHNGQLIFAVQINILKEINSAIDKEKMYFENENLFAWIQSGIYMDRNSDRFKKTAEVMHDYALELRIENIE